MNIQKDFEPISKCVFSARHAIKSGRGKKTELRTQPKLFIPCAIKTQMNLVPDRVFRQLGSQGITENFCNFAKLSYFSERSFHDFMCKTTLRLKAS